MESYYPLSKYDKMTVKEVIESPEFKKILAAKIKSYNERGGLKSGQRFKRTPYDTLIDRRQFTVEYLSEEFFRIDTGISTLSSNLRRSIGSLVIESAKEAYKQIEKAKGIEK